MSHRKNISLVLALAVLTMTVGLSPAFAAITGEVLDGASTNTDAWVTAESAGNYQIDYQPSSGDYSVGPNGQTSTVSASKYGDEREVQTGISSSQSNVDFDIGSRTTIHVNYVLSVDGSISESAMRSHIQSAEDYFQEEHNINFIESSSPTWGSETDTTYSDLRDNVETDVDWDNITGDILIAFLDDDDMTCSGVAATGCTTVESSGGNRPTILVASDSSDFPRTIMHELSHNYGMSHDTALCASLVPGIMGTSCGSNYIMNWRPTHDTDMENRRTWY
ncbi:M12 family metallo-peptidase [Nitrosopumilus sp. b2]|uniref:M12 family metallo-peptidase n=1 Tax=Nitrosopumilus sp. b2 TaxID=2109908 RepID=UPI0015F4DF31|nr:M12 family metallo-peptidase [Nitrosopumilus sp. b2]KAF6245126.1 hypothetical protein C6989_05415 [Nitrosopumilus sp. b2]